MGLPAQLDKRVSAPRVCWFLMSFDEFENEKLYTCNQSKIVQLYSVTLSLKVMTQKHKQ